MIAEIGQMIYSYIILASVNFNFTSFNTEGFIRASFKCYIDILHLYGPDGSIIGNLFWAVVFGFIGVGLYANERSIGTLTAYLILIGIFFSFDLFPYSIVSMFGLILTFLIGIIFYTAFVKESTT